MAAGDGAAANAAAAQAAARSGDVNLQAWAPTMWFYATVQGADAALAPFPRDEFLGMSSHDRRQRRIKYHWGALAAEHYEALLTYSNAWRYDAIHPLAKVTRKAQTRALALMTILQGPPIA